MQQARINDTHNRQAFTSTLIGEYGVSEAYAEAAYLTLEARHIDRADMRRMARDYASRFGITPLPAPAPNA